MSLLKSFAARERKRQREIPHKIFRCHVPLDFSKLKKEHLQPLIRELLVGRVGYCLTQPS
jgi:hypothetical protein